MTRTSFLAGTTGVVAFAACSPKRAGVLPSSNALRYDLSSVTTKRSFSVFDANGALVLKQYIDPSGSVITASGDDRFVIHAPPNTVPTFLFLLSGGFTFTFTPHNDVVSWTGPSSGRITAEQVALALNNGGRQIQNTTANLAIAYAAYALAIASCVVAPVLAPLDIAALIVATAALSSAQVDYNAEHRY